MREQVTPTASITEGMPLSFAARPERKIDSLRASVIFARLTPREALIEVISSTSSGCSAMIGRAPAARTAFAQSFTAMGLVMQ